MSSLEDVLPVILGSLSNGARRKLRCLSRRLRDLVDAHLTVIDLHYCSIDAAKRCLGNSAHYIEVKTLKIGRLDEEGAAALLAASFPQLQELVIDFSHAPAGSVPDTDVLKLLGVLSEGLEPDQMGLQAVRELTLRGIHVGPQAIRAICTLFSELEHLEIDPIKGGSGREVSGDVFGAVAEVGPATVSAALPRLRKIIYPGPIPSVDSLNSFFSVEWGSLVELDLSCWANTATVSFTSPAGAGAQVPNLKILNLSSRRQRISSANLDAFFDANLTSLEVLNLSGIGVIPHDADLRRLSEMPNLRELRLPFLYNHREIQKFMRVTLPRLELIKLGAVEDGNELRVLTANSRRWPSVTALCCFFAPDDDEIAEFCSNPPWNLQSLDISGAGRGFELLGSLPGAARLWTCLRTLRFNGYGKDQTIFDLIPRNAPVVLLQSPWPALEELELSNFIFSDDAAAAISAANQHGRLPKLKRFSLKGSHLRGFRMISICSCPFEQLEELNLHHISDRSNDPQTLSAVLTASVATFPRLSTFWMPRLENPRLEALLAAPWPETLEKVHVMQNFQKYPMEDWAQLNAPRWEAVSYEPPYDNKVKYLRPKY